MGAFRADVDERLDELLREEWRSRPWSSSWSKPPSTRLASLGVVDGLEVFLLDAGPHEMPPVHADRGPLCERRPKLARVTRLPLVLDPGLTRRRAAAVVIV
jgi:hypothetical protein